jgi:reactive intermediate/imine deaminase
MNKRVQYFGRSDGQLAAGHYSPAAAVGDLVFVSGQLPSTAEQLEPGRESFEDQVRDALANVLAVLHSAGSGIEGVVKVTAYIVGVENWGTFNKIYAEVFGDARPARAVVPVPVLHHGYLVEIEAIATRSSQGAITQ